MQLFVDGFVFRHCHVLRWSIVYHSVPVSPLLVSENDEFAGKLAGPELSRDSSNVFGIENGRHVGDYDAW